MSEAAKKSVSMTDLQSCLSPAFTGAVTVVDGKSPLTEDPKRAVIVTYNELPNEILTRFLKEQVRHVCQTDAGALESELNTAALMVQSPQIFLNFPLAAILCPMEATAKKNDEITKLSIQFSEAAQKGQSLDHVRQLLVSAGRSESLISDAVLVADELFTNAIFNAPFINLKSGVNPGIDRNDTTVHMDNGHTAELLVGYDHNRLAIVCRDSYGSLSLIPFLQRIQDCYLKGISTAMRLDGGGAGIGSHMIFNISSSMYVGVCKGKTTVVGTCIQWLWSNRRRSESSKHLHCFEI